MTVVEKVDYLLKHLQLSERQFSAKYRIRKSAIKKWRSGEELPKPENVKYLCQKLNFSVADFLDDNSTLDTKGGYADEHVILTSLSSAKDDVVSEDFPREDNFRYEEKD